MSAEVKVDLILLVRTYKVQIWDIQLSSFRIKTFCLSWRTERRRCILEVECCDLGVVHHIT
jgi:hypothetical protein